MLRHTRELTGLVTVAAVAATSWWWLKTHTRGIWLFFNKKSCADKEELDNRTKEEKDRACSGGAKFFSPEALKDKVEHVLSSFSLVS